MFQLINVRPKSSLSAVVLSLFFTTGLAQAVSIVNLDIIGRLHGTNDAPVSILTVQRGFTGQIDLFFQITSTRITPEAIDGVAFGLGASNPDLFSYVDFGGSHGGMLEYDGPFNASSYSGGALPVAGTDLTNTANLVYFDSATSFQPSDFPSTGSIQLVISTVNALATGSYVFNAGANPPYVTDVSFQDSMNGIFAGTFDRISDFTLKVIDVPEPGPLGLLALGLATMYFRRSRARPLPRPTPFFI